MQEDLVVQTKPERTHYRDADYFVEEVRQRAKGTISKTAENDGLYLRTTLDSRLQSAARMALMKGLESYDHRHGWRGPWGHADVSPDWAKATDVKPAPAERRTWVAAQIDKVGNGVAEITTDQGRHGRDHRRRRGLGQRRQDPAAGRSRLCRAAAAGLQALQPAPGAGGERGAGGDRAQVGPGAGAGGRLQLLAVQLQSGDPGGAPAGLLVQAVRLRHGSGERLHPRLHRARRADLPERGRGQGLQPGELRAHLFGPDAAQERPGLLQEHHDRAPGQGGGHAQDRGGGRPRRGGRPPAALPARSAGRGRGDALPPHRRLFGVRQRRQAHPAPPDRAGRGPFRPSGVEGRPPRLPRLHRAPSTGRRARASRRTGPR